LALLESSQLHLISDGTFRGWSLRPTTRSADLDADFVASLAQSKVVAESLADTEIAPLEEVMSEYLRNLQPPRACTFAVLLTLGGPDEDGNRGS